MAVKKGPKHHPRILLPASLPSLHALLTPAVAHAFDTLRIGAALRDKDEWYAIHVPQPQPTWFELAHGREAERDAYNDRCTEQARRTRKAVLGQHAGFFDFFVPIATGDTVHAVLISGPFSTARPT
ncbi:MAG TPA: hypothetical protein VGP93_21080, partial [Polyangiaceae bacterium]|nr:hypothetical protein [Polyangiaceae bacterium]